LQDQGNSLLNHTADKIVIDEAGRMIISWSNASEIMNDGRLNSDQEITVSMPHNFTIRNGYEYREGRIFKPDGTELFAD
jgi:hypothetical protein